MFVQPYVTFGGVISDTLPGHLARRGHNVEIVSYFRHEEEAKLLSEERNIRFHSIGALSISIPNLVKEFPYFLSLESAIRKIQPDIIHVNNLPFLTTFQSTKIARKIKKKNVVHIHGVMGDRGYLLNLIQRAYISSFGHSIFKCADRVICLTSGDSERVMKSGCPSRKVRIVPNGVDVDRFHALAKEMPNSLLWCGRFVQQKGLGYLIEAMRILVREKGRTEVKLLMSGDGPLLPKISSMVRRYKLNRNVIFMGLLPRKELPKLISQASIYVLPSLNEGMPYVLLEAMACGKPVVGSDISGVNDVISHDKNGYLVPPRCPEAIADAILLLLNDESLRRELGSTARKLMIGQYSWDKVVRNVEEVYYEALRD